MFDIGPEKLLFVLAIALAVLGPERIPHVARGLGKARAEIRRLTGDIHPDALQVLSNPRGALLDAVAEPRRAISETVAEPRLALADVIADFKFRAGPVEPVSAHDATVAATDTIPATPTPDDPAFN